MELRRASQPTPRNINQKTKAVQIVGLTAILKLVRTRMAYSEGESSVSDIGFVKLAKN